jgi:hypothetical protein
MKITSLIITAVISSFSCVAQQNETTGIDYKNNFKINVMALAFKTASLQYERALSDKISITGTFRYMPQSSLPFKGLMGNIAENIETERQVANMELGNIAFMPELRYYFGKNGPMRGFYAGAFANYTRYKASLLYEYDDLGSTDVIPMNGDVNAFTGGIMLGAQWHLGKNFMLDWWILGPNIGKADGEVVGKKTLNTLEQESVRSELEQLDLPFGIKHTYEVNSQGAAVFFNGPWGGVRSGLSIGYRF